MANGVDSAVCRSARSLGPYPELVTKPITNSRLIPDSGEWLTALQCPEAETPQCPALCVLVSLLASLKSISVIGSSLALAATHHPLACGTSDKVS